MIGDRSNDNDFLDLTVYRLSIQIYANIHLLCTNHDRQFSFFFYRRPAKRSIDLVSLTEAMKRIDPFQVWMMTRTLLKRLLMVMGLKSIKLLMQYPHAFYNTDVNIKFILSITVVDIIIISTSAHKGCYWRSTFPA